MSEMSISFVSLPWNRMWVWLGGGRCGENLVIHIFCLFGSWLNGNLHYLISAFSPGYQNKFRVQLLSKFHSQIILLFLQVGFPMVEGVWILSVVDPSQVFCFHCSSLCRKLSFHSWIRSFKTAVGRLWLCKVRGEFLSSVHSWGVRVCAPSPFFHFSVFEVVTQATSSAEMGPGVSGHRIEREQSSGYGPVYSAQADQEEQKTNQKTPPLPLTCSLNQTCWRAVSGKPMDEAQLNFFPFSPICPIRL